MAIITYREAVVRALDEEMARDANVIFFGEDVGKSGGVFKVTPGLYEKYGPLRVRDTPISETAIIGAGIGVDACVLVEADAGDPPGEIDWMLGLAAEYPHIAGVVGRADRLLYGSDWPVCTRDGGAYADTVALLRALVAPLSPAEQAAIAGGTATHVYRL